MCQNYKFKTGFTLGNKCYFRHVEAEEKPSKKSQKGGANGSVALLQESIQLVWVCLKILIREDVLYVNLDCWDRNTPSNSPRARGTKLKTRERKGPSRGIVQKCAAHERSRCVPKFEDRLHEETLQQERCGRGVAWDSDEATFYTSVEARAMPAFTSKRPEERGFAVDSGASMHMLSKLFF